MELTTEAPLSAVPPAVRAVSLRGAWRPDERAWQHKIVTQTESRVRLRARFAERADRVLLLDRANRLGEADLANAFAVIAGEVVTAPARGLLPGLTRAAVLAASGGREEILDERAWRTADELFLTSAVTGIVAVVEVDAHPVGRGHVGPVTRRMQEMLIREWSGPA